jgi:hypothetical protein
MGSVLQLTGPGVKAGLKFFGFTDGDGVGAHEATGTVGKQHAKVSIPFLADPAHVAVITRGELSGGKAEPGGEMACRFKVRDRTRGCCHHGGGGGGDQPNARDRKQQLAGPALPGGFGQLALDLGDLGFEPVLAPTRMGIPNSRSKPRKVLIRAVRSCIHSERIRCKPWSACCSTDLT